MEQLSKIQNTLNRAYSGEVLVDIGWIDTSTKAALKRAVKAGHLATWRGKWFPQAGAPFGMGPDKTCYALPEIAEFFAHMRRSEEAHS